jgi:hypothetical protein
MDGSALGFGPYAYVDQSMPGFNWSPDRYLDVAAAEAAKVIDLFTNASPAPEKWPAGSIANLAALLLGAAIVARNSLEGGDPVRVARDFVPVALLWKHLRDRGPEVRSAEQDAQRVATRGGEAAAEDHLRSLASVGENVVGVDWRVQAGFDFLLTKRAARRVWDKVATDFPYLSSSKGKPKARR